MFSTFVFLLFFSLEIARAQFSSLTNFWPAAHPLAVRSPYLNTWVTSLNGTTNLENWPTHWDLASINGWSGLVRVDGNTFCWLGAPPGMNGTTLLSSHITPTRSIFVVSAGPVQLNITFLSPIEPDDLVKQSFPFMYLSVDVASTDGNPHSVQIYSDISAEWISGVRANVAVWNTTQTATSVYHQAQRQLPAPMQETNNIAEDGNVYYAAKSSSSLSWQSGPDAATRGQFATQGKLLGTQDTTFRAISDNFVVFGLSVDLGNILSSPSSTVWGLGLLRDPVIQYGTINGSQARRSFFWSRFSTVSDAIDAFLTDYDNALSRAAALDQKIVTAAQATSSDYADIVSLGARQTLAGIDFTITQTSSGLFNTSDIKAFMRDTGNSRRTNAVESLYATMPTLLYLNASWIGYLLDPLLQYQASSLYQNSFAAADLGASYPNALGDNSADDGQALEETGDMLIMAWAHASYTGDGHLISTYYNLFKKWADYLVQNTLNPNNQRADGLTKPNMTNLALKGIIAIRAFAAMAAAAGVSSDAGSYSSTAEHLAQQWASQAFTSGHLLSTYNTGSSVALIYNLYPDHLFGFGLVDDLVYQAQTAFYQSLLPQAPKYGFPVDEDTLVVKAQWTIWTAGVATSPDLRNALISMVRSRAGNNLTAGAFPASYNDVTGVTTNPTTSGEASPVMGGAFAVLGLSVKNATSITVPPLQTSSGSGSPGNNSQNNSSGSKTNAGVIAGAVVGGIVGLVALLLLAFLCYRRRRETTYHDDIPRPVPYEQPQPDGGFVGRIPTMPPVNAFAAPDNSKRYPGPAPVNAWDSRSQGSYPESNARNSMATTSRSGGRSAGYSSSETAELRNEVQTMRREMEELRAQREYDMQPPPLYGPI